MIKYQLEHNVYKGNVLIKKYNEKDNKTKNLQ